MQSFIRKVRRQALHSRLQALPYKQDLNDQDKEVTDYNWIGNALSLDELIGFHVNGNPIYMDIADDSSSILIRYFS